MAEASSIIFQGNLNIFAKSGALCPHEVVAAPHTEVSNIPYVLEEFQLRDDCLDPRNSTENILLKLRLIFLTVLRQIM